MLGKAIQSVLDQTFEDWELIIVDDGSTDNTKDLVSSYNDPRIRYIYQQNAERSAARNKGIENAKGDYICFLDSDDYFLSIRLKNLNDCIFNSIEKIGLFFTNISFNLNGEILKKELMAFQGKDIFNYLAESVIFSQQVCVHKSILSLYKFNPDFFIGEDLELWFRIASEFSFIQCTNDYSIVVSDHEDRSVNVKKFNSAREQLRSLKFSFKSPHPGNKVSKRKKREVLSNSYFNSAKYYMFNDQKLLAVLEILKAVIYCPTHIQTKHRFYCLYFLFRGRIPTDYIVD